MIICNTKDNKDLYDILFRKFEELKNNGIECVLPDELSEDEFEYAKTIAERLRIKILQVKGTNKSVNEPFEISANEVKKSNECGDRYYIYRVGNIHSETPKYYKINGKIEENFKLEATNYKASKK